MDITIEEVENLLTNHAEYWPNNFFWEKHDPHSIYNACYRRSITRTDLYSIIQSITRRLQALGISVIHNTNKYQNIAKNSQEYVIEKEREVNPQGALHDVTALKYVQAKRGRRVSAFTNSTAWFVTHPRGKLYLRNPPDAGYLPEIITADDLLCMLWLSSPGVSLAESVDPALSHVIANAVSSTVPNARVLSEFGHNVEKYAKDQIDIDDLARISHAIADRTLKNIQRFNALAEQDPTAFVEELEDTGNRLRRTEKERNEERDRIMAELKDNLEKEKSEHEERLRVEYEKEIVNASKEATKAATQRAKVDAKRENLQSRINDLEKNILFLSTIKTKLENNADKKAKRILWIVILVGLLSWLMVAIFTLRSLNMIDPWISIVGYPIVYYCIAMAYYLRTGNDFKIDPRKIHAALANTFTKRSYMQSGFNPDSLDELEKDRDVLLNELNELEKY